MLQPEVLFLVLECVVLALISLSLDSRLMLRVGLWVRLCGVAAIWAAHPAVERVGTPRKTAHRGPHPEVPYSGENRVHNGTTTQQRVNGPVRLVVGGSLTSDSPILDYYKGLPPKAVKFITAAGVSPTSDAITIQRLLEEAGVQEPVSVTDLASPLRPTPPAHSTRLS